MDFKKMMKLYNLTRRDLLNYMSACAALPLVEGCHATSRDFGKSTANGSVDNGLKLAEGDPKKPKFLIVITATGGANIQDSFLAIRQSQSSNPQGLNTFADVNVKSIADSPFRAVDQTATLLGSNVTTNQSAFVQKHKSDLMVVTMTSTSVNHNIAQKRAITGNDAWGGRTLQEAVAAEYGKNLILPNVNMGTMGWGERGIDQSLPSYAFHEAVADPGYWPLSLDGSKGIQDLPEKNLVNLARKLRDTKLDANSNFFKTFKSSPRIQRWLDSRAKPQAKIEELNLINKLLIYPESAQFPYSQYGLDPATDVSGLATLFPDYQTDPAQAQAMLGYLLITQGVSNTVTIGPGFDTVVDGNVDITSLLFGGGGGNNTGLIKVPPLGFDFSHADHRATQAFMWQRILDTTDKLITLLKQTQFDSTTGESYWDRTMIYIATDFGRDKTRPSGATAFSTGHNLNNGVVILSPMANGNKVLGEVDPNTGLTYGFDLQTGAPNKSRNTEEKELFAGILQALDVNTSGANLPDVKAMRKKV